MKLSVKIFKFITNQPDFMNLSRNQLYRLVDEYVKLVDPVYHDDSLNEDYLVAVIRDYRNLVFSEKKCIKLLEAK